MARPLVFVTRRLPGPALGLLKRHFALDHYDRGVAVPRRRLLEGARRADGLLCLLSDKVDAELLARAPRLKAVATATVGTDHIDLAACAARGVVVTNTPGVLTETSADFTWALLLASARRVVEGDRLVRSGRFPGWDLSMLLGADVHGKTLGLVGFGRIGRAVARRARGFGMTVLYHNRRPVPPREREGARPAGLRELLRRSDFVSLHVPLTPATRHLIGAPELALMKPGAHLVNTARGPVVDEAALVRALRKGRLGGAALDVFEREPRLAPGLASLPNVTLAPHLASASVDTRHGMALTAAQSLVDVLVRRRAPRHPVRP